MSACSSCDEPLKWVLTLSGRRMPLNAQPDKNGNVELVRYGPDTRAEVLAGRRLEQARALGLDLYMPHHATCPSAGEHRRRDHQPKGARA